MDGTDELECPAAFSAQEVTTSRPPEPPKLGGNSIRMSISGPVGHVVNSGETIQLYCQAAPTVDLGAPLKLEWTREDQADLPPERFHDDGEGVLEVRDVEFADAGVYICVAIAGRYVNTAKTTLEVKDNRRPYQPPYQQPSKGYQPPNKGYQPPVQQPYKGYQPPENEYNRPQDDPYSYPPVGMSGAASNVRDLEYDEADDETYEDYAYDYEDYSSLSPPAEPYFSPYNPYSRQQGQQGQVG